MKKPSLSLLLGVTVLLVTFTLGYSLGQSRASSPVTLRVADTFFTLPDAPEDTPSAESDRNPKAAFPVNINTAPLETLMTLPGIGETYAMRIIRYREANGPFSHIEALLNVEGIGEKRLEAILELITIGGS